MARSRLNMPFTRPKALQSRYVLNCEQCWISSGLKLNGHCLCMGQAESAAEGRRNLQVDDTYCDRHQDTEFRSRSVGGDCWLAVIVHHAPSLPGPRRQLYLKRAAWHPKVGSIAVQRIHRDVESPNGIMQKFGGWLLIYCGHSGSDLKRIVVRGAL